MKPVWPPDAVEHMWNRHQLTPAQAEEALNDPYVLVYVPDPASRSGQSDRYVGMCASLGVLVVIVVRELGTQYGANGWHANPRDAKEYWDRRKELEDD
jgi:hypothetical protein